MNCRSSSGRVVSFLERAPLTLIGVSHLGESPAVLRMQLVLIHAQIVSLLTATALSSIFNRNPGYDLRKLLSGSEQILSHLFESFTQTPATLVGAFPSYPMDHRRREIMKQSIQEAMKKCDALFGLLISGGSVVAIEASTATTSLQQWDILLIINFISSNASLRQSETMTTFCLPFYNDAGNFYAYIKYIDDGTCTVFLSANSLVDMRTLGHAYNEVHSTWDVCREEDNGTPLMSLCSEFESMIPKSIRERWSFVYKESQKQQFIWTFPNNADVKDALVRYGSLRVGMFAQDGEYANGPLHNFKLEECGDTTYVALCSNQDELYVQFKTLVSRHDATAMTELLHASLRTNAPNLFV